jgi:SulP family sulfate permease
MKKSGDISEKGLEVGKIADLDGSKPWQDEKEFYEKHKDKVLIKHLYGPLFFGFTSYFKDQISSLPDEIEAVIFRMDRVPYIDQSGLYTLEDIIFDLRAQNIEVVLVGLKEQPLDMLKAIDIIPDLVPENDLFENVEDSFTYLKEQFQVHRASK